jgi:hypothetical protein
MSASTTSPTWARICISSCACGGAMHFRRSCDRSPALSLDGSRGQKGAVDVAASSTAWLGEGRQLGSGLLGHYWGLRHYVFRNQIEGALGPRIRHAFEHGPSRALDPRQPGGPRSPPA